MTRNRTIVQDEIHKTSFSGVDITVVAYVSDLSRLKELDEKRDLAKKEILNSTLSSELRQKTTSSELARARLLDEASFGSSPLRDPKKNFLGEGSTLDFNSPAFDYRRPALTEKLDSNNSLTGLASELQEGFKKEQAQEELLNIESDRHNSIFKLGSISTISYSMFREKFAVRALGHTAAKSYTRGPRTIAGTMIFTLLDDFELNRMINFFNIYLGYKDENDDNGLSTNGITLLDQLPPFSIMLIFSNEYGSNSVMHLHDVEFASEGQSHSISDLTIDKSLNFYAKDLIPLRNVSNSFRSYSDMINSSGGAPSVTNTRKFFDASIPALTFDDILTKLTNPELQELLNSSRRTTV